MPSQPALPRELQSVQVMRGFAALAVVLFHTNLIMFGAHTVLSWLSSEAWLGVNFFFVLSGFIIYTAHEKDFGKPHAIGRYVLRRVTRLYPIYWILLSGFIFAAVLGIGHPEINWDPRQIFTAYTLISVVDRPVLPLIVAWTLLFEVKFYLLFISFLISKRVGLALMTVWGIAILYRASLDVPYDWRLLYPDWGMLSLWNIHFLVGLIAARLIRHIPVNMGFAIASAGAAILLWQCLSLGPMAEIVTRASVMIPLALALGAILCGVVAIERDHGLRFPAFARLAGDASYSIYLVHSPIASQISNASKHAMFAGIPEVLKFWLAFGIAVLAGIAVHKLVEVPVLAVVRRLTTVRRDLDFSIATERGNRI